MSLKYPGDRTGRYDRDRHSGLVGKVIGPDFNGRWLLIVDAYFDNELGITYATTQAILGPRDALDRLDGEVPA